MNAPRQIIGTRTDSARSPIMERSRGHDSGLASAEHDQSGEQGRVNRVVRDRLRRTGIARSCRRGTPLTEPMRHWKAPLQLMATDTSEARGGGVACTGVRGCGGDIMVIEGGEGRLPKVNCRRRTPAFPLRPYYNKVC